jgi:hypothetical protein
MAYLLKASISLLIAAKLAKLSINKAYGTNQDRDATHNTTEISVDATLQ